MNESEGNRSENIYPECPLLVTDVSNLPFWGGIHSGDYGRACAVEGDFGFLPVGEGGGVIFGDHICAACFFQPSPDEAILITGLAEFLPKNFDSGWFSGRDSGESVSFRSPTGKLILFESGNPGSNPDESENRAFLLFEMTPGDIRVDFFQVRKSFEENFFTNFFRFRTSNLFSSNLKLKLG
jgi:hypothetical protein